MHSQSPRVRCIAWNVQSLVNKVDDVMSILADNSIDLAFISETWLSSLSNSTTFIVKTSGYNIAHNFREKRGGGVGIIWSNHLNKQVRTISVCKDFDTFQYQKILFYGKFQMNLICIYRLQETPFKLFLLELDELLSYQDACHPLVLTGDFNVHYEKSNSQNVRDLADLTSSFGLSQFVLGPTNNFGHTIDLLFANKHNLNIESIYPVSYGLGDHFPVFFEVPNVFTPKSCQKRVITYRPVKSVNITSFASDLGTALDSAFNGKAENSSFTELVNIYNDTVTREYDNVAPQQTKSIVDHSLPPWMDAEYRANRSLRRRLERVWKKSSLPTDKKLYITQRDLCVNMAIAKRSKYYSDMIESRRGDQRALFSIVNTLFDKNKSSNILPQYEDPKDLANKFNNFYINKVQQLRCKIPPTNFNRDKYFSRFSGRILDSFRPATVDELKEILKISGIKTSFHDILPASILKQVMDELLPHFCTLVNKSLETGSVEGIKESIIVPLLKKVGVDSEILKNYRPVADLVFLSKLTERVGAVRFYEHMTYNNLHCIYEHGYKKYHSTETLLLPLVNDILLSLDNNMAVILLLIDLSAAFDTVDIDLLLHILEFEIGIGGTALNWFTSFLKGRVQRVVIEKTLSDATAVQFGVPQGSVLGPVLFNIYIRSLFLIIQENGFGTSGYADDNNAHQNFAMHFQFDVINVQLPSLMSKIKEWMNAHFLKLNPDKTEIICFLPNNTNKNHIINGTFFDGNCIRFSETVKNLGFTLDKFLNMDNHVSGVVSHCYKLLGDVARNRHLLNEADTVSLMHAIVSSRLDYCNSLLFGVNKSVVYKFQKVQNAAARLISKRRKQQSVSDVLNNLHWLPVEKRIVFKILVFTFKITHGIAPQCLSGLISFRNKDALVLNLTFFDTNYGRRSFSYAAPRFWNALPYDIRFARNLETFKRLTKTYLFNNFTSLKSNAFMYHN